MLEIKITNENFEQEVINSDKKVIVDFFATWCGPCQMLTPVLSEIAEEYKDKIKVCKINVDEEQENVLLMTLHTAKGLEFKNVFMVGMEDGLFPSYRSIGEEAEIEEERRLCYVGITRAKENLFLTCAKSRTIFGSTSYAMPSRFLTEISSDLMDGEVKKKKQVQENYFDSYERYESNIDNAIYTFGKSIQTPQSAFAFRTAESFLQKINADENVDLGKFEIGQTIQHKKFGTGTITNIEPEDDDLKIEISFEKAGTKRLMAKFADLKIIE